MKGYIIISITNSKNSKDRFQGNNHTVVGSVIEDIMGIQLQVMQNNVSINIIVVFLAHIEHVDII
jgi:hypothetical protein